MSAKVFQDEATVAKTHRGGGEGEPETQRGEGREEVPLAGESGRSQRAG